MKYDEKNPTSDNAMEKTISFPSDISDDQKYLYGTYFEIGFHNFFMTLNLIYGKIIGKDAIEEAKKTKERKYIDFAHEGHVWNPMFEAFSELLPENILKVNSLFAKHFPFLVPLWENEKNKRTRQKGEQGKYLSNDVSEKAKLDFTVNVLKRFSQVIRICRNYYSHYRINVNGKQVETYLSCEPFILRYLEECYDSAKNIVKERFSLTDKDTMCAERYKTERSKTRFDNRGRALFQKVRNNSCLYHLDNGNKTLSSFAYILMTSLFLEKKYSRILAESTNRIKLSDRNIMCELIAVHRFRLKVNNISVQNNPDSIALDILNEIRKCPKELFGIISKKDQDSFRTMAKVSDDADTSEVLMRRSSDRFAGLLMKYIDEARIFKDIRFMVSLGKYFFKFYNKTCIDGNSRVRCLSKNITGFGRISEIERARKTLWDNSIRNFEDVHCNTSDESPYITDHRANYVFCGEKNGKRIGLRIYSESDETKMTIPELEPGETQNVSPTCWMSIYEMPAMAFLLHLTNNDSTVENIIKDTAANYTRLYSDIRDGKLIPQDEATISRILHDEYGGITLNRITKNIKLYLTKQNTDAQPSFEAWAKSHYEDLLAETETRIARFKTVSKLQEEQKSKNIGKSKYINDKVGKYADFIAHDMMRFQPSAEDGRDKLTSLNYRILQSLLATYTEDRYDELIRALKSAHIIGNSNKKMDNPIVSSMFSFRKKYKDVNSLYKAYLIARGYYLKLMLKLKDFSLLRKDNKKWQKRTHEFYKQLAGRYLNDEYGGKEFEKSLELPRGMFEDAIRTKLSKYEAMRMVANDRTKNVSYLIYSYFIKDDDCQRFYMFDRSYPIFNALYKAKPHDADIFRSVHDIYTLLSANNPQGLSKQIENCKLNGQELRNRVNLNDKKNNLMAKYRELKNNETLLKRYKIQDMLLFLIAKSILSSDGTSNGNNIGREAMANIKLKNITDGKVLSQSINFSVEVELPDGSKKIICQPDLKLKKYCLFFRFIQDRRIPSLFELVTDKEIPRELLEKELENYDNVHPEVVRNALAFEKTYFFKKESPYDGKGAFSYSKLAYILKKLEFPNKDTILDIRNSFSHQTYSTKVAEAMDKNNNDAKMPNKAKIIAKIFEDSLIQRQ